MAMTKAEKCEMEELRNELLRAKAWRRTEPVERDVEIPNFGEGLAVGWVYYASGGAFSFTGDRVDVSCSDSLYHATGRTDKTTSQRAIRQFSTKLLALKALRYAVEEDCVDRLARIDAMIEEAKKGA